MTNIAPVTINSSTPTVAAVPDSLPKISTTHSILNTGQASKISVGRVLNTLSPSAKEAQLLEWINFESKLQIDRIRLPVKEFLRELKKFNTIPDFKKRELLASYIFDLEFALKRNEAPLVLLKSECKRAQISEGEINLLVNAAKELGVHEEKSNSILENLKFAATSDFCFIGNINKLRFLGDITSAYLEALDHGEKVEVNDQKTILENANQTETALKARFCAMFFEPEPKNQAIALYSNLKKTEKQLQKTLKKLSSLYPIQIFKKAKVKADLLKRYDEFQNAKKEWERFIKPYQDTIHYTYREIQESKLPLAFPTILIIKDADCHYKGSFSTNSYSITIKSPATDLKELIKHEMFHLEVGYLKSSYRINQKLSRVHSLPFFLSQAIIYNQAHKDPDIIIRGKQWIEINKSENALEIEKIARQLILTMKENAKKIFSSNNFELAEKFLAEHFPLLEKRFEAYNAYIALTEEIQAEKRAGRTSNPLRINSAPEIRERIFESFRTLWNEINRRNIHESFNLNKELQDDQELETLRQNFLDSLSAIILR